MTRKPFRLMLVVIATFALLVAACGSASDKVAEKLAEELIEASSDGEVDIDVSGDGDDATIKIETDEGSFSMGVGGDLPDGLDIPVPDGGDILTSFVADDGMSVTLSYTGDRFDEISGFYDDWTGSSGDEWDRQTFTMESDGETIRNTMWIQSSGDSAIQLTDCPGVGSESADADAVCLTVSQGS